MLHLAYSIHPDTSQTIQTIDLHRSNILLTGIPPKVLRQLTWDSMLTRIQLAQTPKIELDATHIGQILTQEVKYTASDTPQLIQNYKTAFSYIREEWTANTKPITVDTIITVAQLLNYRVRKTSNKTYPISEVAQLLEYIQMQKDHPMVSAVILLSQWVTLGKLPNISAMAYLIAYLFLYKYGYDFRDLLVIEGLGNTPRLYQAAQTELSERGTCNLWISYALNYWEKQLAEVEETVVNEHLKPTFKTKYVELTDRQQRILGATDSPEVRITNLAVQKRFGVSQITASRDLSKLSAMGLLYPHNKGRSTYYTKI
jgi:hypothetical protein